MDLMRRAPAHSLALSLLVCAHAAHAVDSLPPPYATDFAPFTMTVADAGGFWAQGETSGRAMFARFDGAGGLVRTFPHSYGFTLTPLGDGSLFASSGCLSEIVEAQGTQRWRSDPFFASGYSCAPPVIDAAGSTWILAECFVGDCVDEPARIVRLDTRGIVRTDETIVGRPAVPGPLVAARVGTGAWLGQSDGLVRIAADGVATGAWFSGVGRRVDRIAVDAADRAWAFAPVAADGATAPQLRFGLVGHDARLVRSGVVATVERPDVVAAAADATGALALVADVTFSVGSFGEPLSTYAALRVHRFDAGGAQAWTRDLVPNAACPSCTATLAPNGDAIVAFAPPGDPLQPATRLVRYAPDGTLRGEAAVQGTVSTVRAQPDGSALVLVVAADGSRRFARFSPTGQEVVAPSLTDVAPGQPELLATRFERSGVATTLARDPREPRVLLTGYAADGGIAWRRESAESLSDAGTPAGNARIAGNGRTTCWAAFRPIADDGYAELVAECMDAGTGALRWRRTLSSRARFGELVVGLTSDDALIVAFDEGERTAIAEIGTDGSVRAVRSYVGYLRRFAANERGDVLIGTERRLALVARNGTIAWTRDAPGDTETTAHALANDGTAAYLAITRPFPQFPRRRLVLVAADGMEQWRSTEAAYNAVGAIAFLGADPVLAEIVNGELGATNRRVTRYARATGATVATWSSTEDDATRILLALDPATQVVAVASASRQRQRLRIAVVDMVTGAARLDLATPCASAECAAAAVALDANGRARYAETAGFDIERPGGPRWRLRTVPAPAGSARTDQSGLAGAWYPEYAQGQGLFLEWLPVSRVAFGTWFTFSRFDGNSPSGLRWYSLQGQLPDAPDRARLVIYENRGGSFAAPPATTARAVGEAFLTLEGCERATLEYRLSTDEIQSETGRYSLVRLTRPLGCVDTAGVATPPAAPAAGFDPAQSGAWFTPATSGQGLDLSIEPGGSFFGAWFTFDPAGIADDATGQHWFTLQGSLAGAANGRVVVPIYATIGGAFDRKPTRNTFRVGEATIAFTACDRATLDYRFDADETAGAFAARTGSLALQRLGGCAR